ncbi:S9 family peptidase [Candidatus Thorarchaeota archaeon]|nr:MAG: S9 family peptidase [Candidatus Thorarchaeota archaeon]
MHVMRPLDLDRLLVIPEIDSVKISPNKKYAALTINRLHENYDVFLCDLESSGDMIPLTRTPEYTYMTDWAPDSKSIIVGEDTGRNERVTLYRIFIDSPFDMTPLTPKDPHYFMRGGYFSPNSDFIAYAVNYDYDIRKETETFRIVVQDIESEKRIAVARPDKPSYTTLSIHPKGKYILYNRSDEDPSGVQWWTVTPQGDQDREILNFGPTAKVTAEWTYDGRIAFSTDTIDGERHDSVAIGIFDPNSEKTEWLAMPSDDEPYDAISVPKRSQHILMIREREGKRKPFIYDLEHETIIDSTTMSGNLWPISPLSLDQWLGVYYSSISPKNLIKFNPFSPKMNEFEFLTDMLSASGIQSSDLTSAEEHRWISVDNTMVHGWLYRPKFSNSRTIIKIHGGPTAHSEDALDVDIQYFCSLGYTVLDPNYRGSTGYGVYFRELIKNDGWGGKDLEDVRTGILSLFENGYANPNRVGIFGTSYGGYMSWNAITHFNRQEVAAAAPICGMTDLIIDYETTRPDLRPYSEEMLGGSPKEVPQIYHERSPINYVSNIKGKLLIVQGLRDPNVTKTNVAAIEKQLNAYNIHYEKLVFDNEGHGIIRESNVKMLLKRLAEFFEISL